ncbi:toxin glutamine deamidase domain-containing protein [Streptomyces nigra]|uniref:toxin glutamine deamidase domain-containing protein n=1 Tax=Streptomyces nigra TaxID=1827580 RepID=UPI0030CF3BD5
MMLPDELEWVLEMLGYRWPTADEDKLRDCAEVWRKFGEKVTELHGTANGAARQVTAHNAGESIDKFVKTYEKFDGGGGGDGYLRNAAEAAFLIANVLEACAYLVEFAKWAVIAQLIALAIEIVAAHAAAPFTFGLSEVAGLGATQITRLIVRRLLDELKQALLEAIVETMKEPAISAIEAIITDLIRQTVNVGFGAQEGYDVGATLKAGGTAGLDALKQSPQTFAEGVRDSLGQKAGSRARHAIDSRLDGYDGTSGLPSGDVGSDPGTDNSSSSSSSSDSSSASSSNSNSSGSDSSSSNGSDSSTSTRSSNGSNLPGTNIGNGISADTGGNDIGGPNLGPGPDSGSGPGTDSSSPTSSDTPYSRPTQSPTDSSLSDFDDPSPGARSPSGSDSPTSSTGSPSTPGPSHNGGVSGLSSPSPQSTPTHTSSPGTSSTPSGGSIGTQVDNLAATAPTQSNAAPTPTTGDASPSGSGGRSDGGSGMPTSPTAAAATGTAPGTSHSGGPSGGSPSATSPQPNSGPARNPSSGTPGTAPAAGTGPASTPRPTSPTVPRSTPAPTPDGRTPGTTDSRTPGTPDNRIPAQRPGGTPTGDAGTTPRNTPGTPPADRTSPRTNPTTATDGNTPRPRPGTPAPNDGTTPRTPSTTPNDSATSRNNPGTTPNDGTSSRNRPTTTPGDGTTPRNTAGSTPNDRGDRTPPRTDTPGNPSTTPRGDSTPRQTSDPTGSSRTPPPSQNPTQSTPPRTTPPPSNTPTTSPSTTTPSGTTPHSASPGPTTHTPTPQSGTPGTPNQPNSGTPSRPPQQPAGSTPTQPGPHPQPQPHTQQPPASPPNPQQQQVTPVPIHHVTTTPSGQPTPSAPHTPDSGHTTTPDQNNNASDSTKPREAPTPASQTRNNNPPGGVTDPSRAEQDALENSVPRDENGDPTRPPDPADGPWVQRINGEGTDAPGRSNNCVDTALSTVDTYAGNPTAAGARTPDLDADGNPSDRGERGGRDRIENTLGARFSDMGNGRDAFNRLENTLRDSGHGSQAVIITQDANGRAHAWNAVNHNGKITYIDAQTGQQSRNPLHSGDHGVFAIPLDSNRQPVPASTPTTDSFGQPHRGTSTAPTGSDRRPAEDPAGAPPEEPAGTPSEEPDATKPARFDPEAVRGSAQFGERQGTDHLHEGMPLESSQATLRQTHDVYQVDLGPVLQNAHRWAEDGSLNRVVAEARENGHVTQSRLNEILGDNFRQLNDDQKMAVVAGIARISSGFHEAHAAGNNPIEADPDRRREKGIERGVNPLPGVGMHDNHRVRRGNDDSSSGPLDVRARKYAIAQTAGNDPEARREAQDRFDALWNDHKDGDLRPDMSGKNYAVLEVHEEVDGKTEVHYVIDTSIPTGANYHQDHSEPHLGEWMRQVEAEHPGRYKAVSLFTEFEPCGDKTGKGGANCSDYLSYDRERDDDTPRARNKDARDSRPDELKQNPPKSDLRISYGIGYRAGAMGHEAEAAAKEYASDAERNAAIEAGKKADNAERKKVKGITDEQMVQYRGEWLRAWQTAADSTS